MIVVIKFTNGDVFHIDAAIVANDRTEYYMQVDGITDRNSKEWAEEMQQSMKESELYDWIQNNMNWSDIEPYAQLQPRQCVPFNYHDRFIDSSIEFIN